MRKPPHQHPNPSITESDTGKDCSPNHGCSTEDEFLTRALLRARWKCSDSTIKRREKVGLKATHLGGHTVRYRMTDIVAFEQQA